MNQPPRNLDPRRVDQVLTLLCLLIIGAAFAVIVWRVASAPTGRPPIGDVEVTPATCCPPVIYEGETGEDRNG